jgi:Flp pilus assembly protein TadG
MMIMDWRSLKSMWSDKKGVAAVEFALVLPLLAVILMGIATLVPFELANNNMRNGVTAGANYVMTGGSDPTVIQTIALQAWDHHQPSDTVVVQQYCSCSGVPGSCSSTCPDKTSPQGYTQISASSTYPTIIFDVHKSLSAQQVVRTR